MYYSELVKKACVLMFEAHKNDLDKGGYPYVFHPFYLATQMEDEASTCVALLHDVIEDHGDEYTYTIFSFFLSCPAKWTRTIGVIPCAQDMRSGFSGAATRIRTGDLILTKDALYRLSYSSIQIR